jgi:hypothetical protein
MLLGLGGSRIWPLAPVRIWGRTVFYFLFFWTPPKLVGTFADFIYIKKTFVDLDVRRKKLA